MIKIKFGKFNSIILTSSERIIDDNIFYILETPPQDDTLILLLRNGMKPILFVSDLEIGNYKRNDIIIKRYSKNEIEKSIKALKEPIGINYESISLKTEMSIKKIKKSKLYDVSQIFSEMRSIKTKKEVKKIRKACKITLDAIKEVPELVEKCKTERDLLIKLESIARDNGANGTAFSTIIASGKNSSIPHYKTSKNKIKKGFLIVDFGCKFDGYCSDITRTFYFGRASEKEKELFSYIYEAKKMATKECFSGNKASNVHIIAEKIIEQKTKQKLIHSIGHGIGMRTHDFPAGINSNSNTILKENMCLSIEPGYYNKCIGGIRLEDIIIVKKRKCKEITKTENELIEI